jgi:hypothetical protein
VDPVLGWEVEERQQLVLIVSDLLDGLGELRAVQLLECADGCVGVVLVFVAPDLGQRLLRGGLRGLRERIQYVRCFMKP